MHLPTIVPAHPDPWPEHPSPPCVPPRRARPLQVRVASSLVVVNPKNASTP